jgi:opacity protein-like surface antigen
MRRFPSTSSKLYVTIIAVAATMPTFARAEQPSADAWQFEATPYLWAAGMSGWSRVGARTPTANIDVGFSDVWKALNFGAMGSFEARKGRWGIILDGIYVNLSKTSDPLLNGQLGTVRLKMAQTIFEAAGAYRVLDSPVTPVDVLAGVRYTYLHGDLSYSGGPLLPNGASRDNSTSWTDGFIGVRASYAFSEKWSIFGYADAGTGGTKHSWQLIAGADYNFTKSIAAKVGYRIISMDYEQPNFLYNIKTEGFFTGVSIKF